MILEILIFLLTTLIGYYIYSYKQIHYHFKQIGVKYVPGVPIFGNLLSSTFLKKHAVKDLEDVYFAYPDEKYVGLIELTAPIILIRDPEIIKSITVKDFDHFIDHKEFFSPETDPLFAFSLFALKGDKWRDMRTTLSPAFTASKMKYMMPCISDITNNIVEYLQEHQSENIDVDDLVRRYTNDVIASAGFGLQVNSLKDRDNDFYKIGSTIFDFDIKQRIIAVLVTQFPQFAKKIGARLFPEKTYTFFRDIVASTMEYRKKQKVERPDMIQLLMEAPKEWTPEELTSQVFLFFAAGFETSASALAMAIHELALHPEVQEKLYQEITKFEEKKELTFDNLSELKYLDCLINETLRKWSPAIALDRLCVKSFELPPPREGGQPHTLKPGDIVYNMVNCIQLDPKYFPEPQKFNPDRFSDENKHNIQPFTFLPFGSGPRICIGMRFAMMELKVLLYQIVLNFNILKTEKTSDPIKLKPHAFNIRALGGTWVKFEKRE